MLAKFKTMVFSSSDKENGHIGMLPSHFYLLERRILLDASAAPVALEVANAQEAAPSPSEADTAESLLAYAAKAESSESTDTKELVFVDASITNLDDFINNLDGSLEVIILDQNKDGVLQIVDYLDSHNLLDSGSIDSLHIISHGSAGELSLGSTTLNLDSMQNTYANELTQIGLSLSTNADILIYGCDFALGDKGYAAASYLSDQTSADVAASIDITGHAALGGDWLLEQSIGLIESSTINNSAWHGSLVVLNDTFRVAAGNFINILETALNDEAITRVDALSSNEVAIDSTSNPGTISYRSPDTDATFTYDTASATGLVVNLNNTFDSTDDFLSVNEGETVNILISTLEANDLDTYLASQTTPIPSNGTLVLTSPGNFLYTPNANYSGVDSFKYITGSLTVQNETTVYITVNAQAQAEAGTYTNTTYVNRCCIRNSVG